MTECDTLFHEIFIQVFLLSLFNLSSVLPSELMSSAYSLFCLRHDYVFINSQLLVSQSGNLFQTTDISKKKY